MIFYKNRALIQLLKLRTWHEKRSQNKVKILKYQLSTMCPLNEKLTILENIFKNTKTEQHRLKMYKRSIQIQCENLKCRFLKQKFLSRIWKLFFKNTPTVARSLKFRIKKSFCCFYLSFWR